MKVKKNIVALIMFCVLAFSIVGLSIGIILVAQQATVMNSMSIRYEATNVDCTVVSSAKLYNNSSDTDGTDVKILNSEDTTFTTTFTSSEPGTDNVLTKDGMMFNPVTLTSTGRVVYIFDITNDADVENLRLLKLQATVTDGTDDVFDNNNNIVVKIGAGTNQATAEEDANAMITQAPSRTANIGVANAKTTLVVIAHVNNASKDVTDYQLKLQLDFSYSINQDDWDGTSNANNLPTPVMTATDSAEYLAGYDRVITITSAEEFAAISAYMKDSNNIYTTNETRRKHGYHFFTDESYRTLFRLDCDIDLKNIPFDPIGYGYITNIYDENNVKIDSVTTSGCVFAGDFDGQGHTIRNLNINKDGVNYGGNANYSPASAGIALFGYVGNSRITNLNVANANIVGNHYVGGIVGYSMTPHASVSNRGAKIENCHVISSVINCKYANEEESGDKAGGIVGCYYRPNVSYCSVADSVIMADRDAGLVAGHLQKEETNSYTFKGNSAITSSIEWNRSSSHIENYTKGNTNMGIAQYGYLIGRTGGVKNGEGITQ